MMVRITKIQACSEFFFIFRSKEVHNTILLAQTEHEENFIFTGSVEKPTLSFSHL